MQTEHFVSARRKVLLAQQHKAANCLSRRLFFLPSQNILNIFTHKKVSTVCELCNLLNYKSDCGFK